MANVPIVRLALLSLRVGLWVQQRKRLADQIVRLETQ